jgi:hypothetical protein
MLSHDSKSKKKIILLHTHYLADHSGRGLGHELSSLFLLNFILSVHREIKFSFDLTVNAIFSSCRIVKEHMTYANCEKKYQISDIVIAGRTKWET